MKLFIITISLLIFSCSNDPFPPEAVAKAMEEYEKTVAVSRNTRVPYAGFNEGEAWQEGNQSEYDVRVLTADGERKDIKFTVPMGKFIFLASCDGSCVNIIKWDKNLQDYTMTYYTRSHSLKEYNYYVKKYWK
jgi:hypothetical protein